MDRHQEDDLKPWQHGHNLIKSNDRSDVVNLYGSTGNKVREHIFTSVIIVDVSLSSLH